MKAFHVFKCVATVDSHHEKYLPLARLPMIVWIDSEDEAAAVNSVYEVLSRLHYQQVEIEKAKKVDAQDNDFLNEQAQEYATMRELGWCVIAYPEPTHRR